MQRSWRSPNPLFKGAFLEKASVVSLLKKGAFLEKTSVVSPPFLRGVRGDLASIG
jgi:hypothetical protein